MHRPAPPEADRMARRRVIVAFGVWFLLIVGLGETCRVLESKEPLADRARHAYDPGDDTLPLE